MRITKNSCYGKLDTANLKTSTHVLYLLLLIFLLRLTDCLFQRIPSTFPCSFQKSPCVTMNNLLQVCGRANEKSYETWDTPKATWDNADPDVAKWYAMAVGCAIGSIK